MKKQKTDSKIIDRKIASNKSKTSVKILTKTAAEASVETTTPQTKNSKITLNNYNNLLKNIKNCIQQAGEKIAKTSVREKVVMSWQIGKLVSENLAKNTHSGYGDRLLTEL